MVRDTSWLFVVNPVAGGRRAARLWPQLAAQLDRERVHHQTVFTRGPGHAIELARENRDKYDRIVSVGGDGTCQEVVQGLTLPGDGNDQLSVAALGVLPLGTGNDFSRGLGLPLEPSRALATLLTAPVQTVDLAKVNGRPFINVAGIGFDAEVAALINRTRWRLPGPIMYLGGILVQLVTYRNAPVHLTWEGGELTRVCLMVAVGNGSCYAGGMRMTPQAQMDDGLFDVVVVGDLRRAQVLPLLPRVFRGSHVTHPQVEVFRCRHLKVEGPTHLSVHADGEVVGHLPVEFENEPGRLRVLRPLAGSAQKSQPRGSQDAKTAAPLPPASERLEEVAPPRAAATPFACPSDFSPSPSPASPSPGSPSPSSSSPQAGAPRSILLSATSRQR